MTTEIARRMLILVTLVLVLPGRRVDAAEPVKGALENARRDAAAMSEAFVKGDYETFTRYMYPRMFELAGDKKQLIEVLKRGLADMKAQGFRFLSSSVKAPKEIIKAGDELTTLVPQEQVIDVPAKHGELHALGYLIGVSRDAGKTWTFIDASGATQGTLKQILPNYNPKLKIPPKAEPKFVEK
jgi:hypothetical protein